jgi:hypothetical protein
VKPDDVLVRLARESGRLLGELGVRPEDGKWIRAHAETIAGLAGERVVRRRIYEVFARWARRAARAAR